MTPGSKEWLEARRKGIGASEAAAAVGLSQWMTPLELYLDKRGELERHEENEPMRWGTLLEPVIRQRYADVTGRTVRVPNEILRHPTIEFALANLDGIVEGPEDRLFEAKTARTADGWGEPGTDAIPLQYLLQCQHGMAVAGLSSSDVAVLISGSDFRIYHVPADPDLQATLFGQEAVFWAQVLDGLPPEPISASDVKLRWKTALAGRAIQASEELETLARQLSLAKAVKKLADETEEALATRIKSAMEDAETLLVGDMPLATWKNAKDGVKFDAKLFEADHPAIYKQYLRESPGSRRFLLKQKAEICLPIQMHLPNSQPAELMAVE